MPPDNQSEHGLHELKGLADMMPNLLQQIPGTRWHPDHRLMTWHPTGTLDDALADRIIEFVTWQETISATPFHRYTEFDGLTDIQLKFGHTFNMADIRRSTYEGERVKSAFHSDWVIGLGMARLYAELMKGAPIEVRAFRKREEAAEWLGVPMDLLATPV